MPDLIVVDGGPRQLVLTTTGETTTVLATEGRTVVLSASVGLRGSQGTAGTFVRHNQTVPAVEWVIAHEFGRPPNVVLHDENGERYEAEIIDNVAFTEVTIRHETGPEVGSAWLT